MKEIFGIIILQLSQAFPRILRQDWIYVLLEGEGFLIMIYGFALEDLSLYSINNSDGVRSSKGFIIDLTGDVY